MRQSGATGTLVLLLTFLPQPCEAARIRPWHAAKQCRGDEESDRGDDASVHADFLLAFLVFGEAKLRIRHERKCSGLNPRSGQEQESGEQEARVETAEEALEEIQEQRQCCGDGRNQGAELRARQAGVRVGHILEHVVVGVATFVDGGAAFDLQHLVLEDADLGLDGAVEWFLERRLRLAVEDFVGNEVARCAGVQGAADGGHAYDRDDRPSAVPAHVAAALPLLIIGG